MFEPLVLPALQPSNVKSLRFYQADTATTLFADKKYSFVDSFGKQAWSYGIRITATTADLEFSFDGINIHGKVKAATTAVYERRHEGCIYVRGNGSVFTLEVW